MDLLRTTPVETYNVPWYGVSWFLLSFFLVKLMSVSNLLNSLKFGLSLFICSFYLNQYFDNILLSILLCLGHSLMLLFFYNLGKNNNLFINVYSTKVFLFLSFVVLSIVVYSTNDFQNFKLVNYHHMLISYNPFISIVISFLGIVSVIYISLVISKTTYQIANILEFLGKYSLFIFLSRLFIIFLIEKIFKKIFDIEVSNLILLINVMVFSYVLLKFYEKIFIRDKINADN